MVKRPVEAEGVQSKRACSTAALDFETLPLIQNVIESTQLVEYPCITSLPRDDETSLEFRIDKTDAYTDLSQTFINLKVQILKADGKKLGADDVVAPINNSLYSFFQGVDLYINENRLTVSDTNYPHWNYIKTLLFASPLERNTFFDGASWHRDTPGKFDVITTGKMPTQDRNKGFEYRREKFSDSKEVNLFARLNLNVMFERLIPAQTEILIRLHRKPPTFSLMAKAGSTFKIRVVDARIYTSRVKLSDAASYAFDNLLSREGFFYPTLNVVTRTKTVSKGDQNVEWVPFNGQLPRRIYIFQTSQDAFNNKVELNPFNFKPFGINKVQVFRNGLSLPSSQGLANIQADAYLKSYMQTYCAINRPDLVDIKWSDFGAGYGIFAIDVSNDQSSGCGYYNPPTSGTLRIAIDYKSALTAPITLFCVAEMPALFRLDGDRNITWQ